MYTGTLNVGIRRKKNGKSTWLSVDDTPSIVNNADDKTLITMKPWKKYQAKNQQDLFIIHATMIGVFVNITEDIENINKYLG